jgi:hypothetical protein
VELTLTPEGRELAEQVAEIEQAMYQWIDAATAEQDTDAVRAFLWTLVGGQPSGEALALRK